MTTELFIENYPVDMSGEISALITFELDNVKNFAARGTSWSKTVVLPGTANNNKLFGHIFQIGQSNPHNEDAANIGVNYNAAKSADALLFQDQVQSFKGVMRLLQINVVQGRMEYEVGLLGELSGLSVSLKGGLLEDLDFSAYDHEYTTTNIINSWDAAPGTGYYYPLIDYGTASVAKHNWHINTFRPALFVKEYIDKMFAAAGFRYSSALFNTTRFKRLIIPHNNKTLNALSTFLLNASGGSQAADVSPYLHIFGTIVGTGFTSSGGGTIFTYAGATNAVVDIDFNFEV